VADLSKAVGVMAIAVTPAECGIIANVKQAT